VIVVVVIFEVKKGRGERLPKVGRLEYHVIRIQLTGCLRCQFLPRSRGAAETAFFDRPLKNMSATNYYHFATDE
jgi:hypothetical protein